MLSHQTAAIRLIARHHRRQVDQAHASFNQHLAELDWLGQIGFHDALFLFHAPAIRIGHTVIRIHADADVDRIAQMLTDAVDDHKDRSGSVLEAASELAWTGESRQKLTQDIFMTNLYIDRIKARLLGKDRAVNETADDLLDLIVRSDGDLTAAAVNAVVIVHIRILADSKRRGLPLLVIAAAAGMGKLQDVIGSSAEVLNRLGVGLLDHFPDRLNRGRTDNHLKRIAAAVF